MAEFDTKFNPFVRMESDKDSLSAMRDAVAMYLAKSEMPPDQAFEVIKKMCIADHADYTDDEIRNSLSEWYMAYATGGKKEVGRFISKEVAEYVAVTTGDFSVTDCDRNLGFVTSCDKAASRKAIQRLKERGIIEPCGKRDGWYRKVQTELNHIVFDDTEEKPFPIILPFGLHNMVDISEGNIILIGGEFNSGKTTFCLESLLSNKNRIPIRYLSSEVSHQSEFKKRWRKYTGIPVSFWYPDEMTEYVSRSSEFASALRPGALNIIDYLEFPESDFTLGGEILRQIHDKLSGGVALIAIQKKQGTRLPRSGDLVMEKPRLAVTLSSADGKSGSNKGVAEIVKAKLCRGGNHNGKKLIFETVDEGSRFKIVEPWGFLRA
jgi:hypothetical protein